MASALGSAATVAVPLFGEVLALLPPSCPMHQKIKTIRTSHVNSDVRRGFAPQLGHDFAFLLISCLHSWHLTRAICTSPVVRKILRARRSFRLGEPKAGRRTQLAES